MLGYYAVSRCLISFSSVEGHGILLMSQFFLLCYVWHLATRLLLVAEVARCILHGGSISARGTTLTIVAM
ncbi:uncharacterized protein BJX67DRAFT_358752 [Aspergillus lucknowensis]|uniref:Uncharacterized protein n=1 Tax=Aspergillus lucknowensis TaxID=176173 RepID=A0ABR4LLP5_9EURO